MPFDVSQLPSCFTMLVCGGPKTGKSMVVARLLSLLRQCMSRFRYPDTVMFTTALPKDLRVETYANKLVIIDNNLPSDPGLLDLLFMGKKANMSAIVVAQTWTPCQLGVFDVMLSDIGGYAFDVQFACGCNVQSTFRAIAAVDSPPPFDVGALPKPFAMILESPESSDWRKALTELKQALIKSGCIKSTCPQDPSRGGPSLGEGFLYIISDAHADVQQYLKLNISCIVLVESSTECQLPFFDCVVRPVKPNKFSALMIHRGQEYTLELSEPMTPHLDTWFLKGMPTRLSILIHGEPKTGKTTAAENLVELLIRTKQFIPNQVFRFSDVSALSRPRGDPYRRLIVLDDADSVSADGQLKVGLADFLYPYAGSHNDNVIVIARHDTKSSMELFNMKMSAVSPFLFIVKYSSSRPTCQFVTKMPHPFSDDVSQPETKEEEKKCEPAVSVPLIISRLPEQFSILICGPPRCGKTTAAERLAKLAIQVGRYKEQDVIRITNEIFRPFGKASPTMDSYAGKLVIVDGTRIISDTCACLSDNLTDFLWRSRRTRTSVIVTFMCGLSALHPMPMFDIILYKQCGPSFSVKSYLSSPCGEDLPSFEAVTKPLPPFTVEMLPEPFFLVLYCEAGEERMAALDKLQSLLIIAGRIRHENVRNKDHADKPIGINTGDLIVLRNDMVVTPLIELQGHKTLGASCIVLTDGVVLDHYNSVCDCLMTHSGAREFTATINHVSYLFNVNDSKEVQPKKKEELSEPKPLFDLSLLPQPFVMRLLCNTYPEVSDAISEVTGFLVANGRAKSSDICTYNGVGQIRALKSGNVLVVRRAEDLESINVQTLRSINVSCIMAMLDMRGYYYCAPHYNLVLDRHGRNSYGAKWLDKASDSEEEVSKEDKQLTKPEPFDVSLLPKTFLVRIMCSTPEQDKRAKLGLRLMLFNAYRAEKYIPHHPTLPSAGHVMFIETPGLTASEFQTIVKSGVSCILNASVTEAVKFDCIIRSTPENKFIATMTESGKSYSFEPSATVIDEGEDSGSEEEEEEEKQQPKEIECRTDSLPVLEVETNKEVECSGVAKQVTELDQAVEVETKKEVEYDGVILPSAKQVAELDQMVLCGIALKEFSEIAEMHMVYKAKQASLPKDDGPSLRSPITPVCACREMDLRILGNGGRASFLESVLSKGYGGEHGLLEVCFDYRRCPRSWLLFEKLPTEVLVRIEAIRFKH